MVGDQAAALQQQQVVKGLQHSQCGVNPAEFCVQSSKGCSTSYHARSSDWTACDVCKNGCNHVLLQMARIAMGGFGAATARRRKLKLRQQMVQASNLRYECMSHLKDVN